MLNNLGGNGNGDPGGTVHSIEVAGPTLTGEDLPSIHTLSAKRNGLIEAGIEF